METPLRDMMRHGQIRVEIPTGAFLSHGSLYLTGRTEIKKDGITNSWVSFLLEVTVVEHHQKIFGRGILDLVKRTMETKAGTKAEDDIWKMSLLKR